MNWSTLKALFKIIKDGGALKEAVIFLCIYGAACIGFGLLLAFIFWIVSIK